MNFFVPLAIMQKIQGSIGSDFAHYQPLYMCKISKQSVSFVAHRNFSKIANVGLVQYIKYIPYR